MTDDMMHLRSLVEKTADADLLREMISFAAERLMELEVGALTGAGYARRALGASSSATACPGLDPGGYRDRDRQTRAGTVELRTNPVNLAPCARVAVPRHRHKGLEIILVLYGSQSDENGTYRAGSLVLNPVGGRLSDLFTPQECANYFTAAG